MAKTMKPQKPGNFPRASGTERVLSWTVQNEVRYVLGQKTTGAASKILNSRDKNLTEGCVYCSKDKRGQNEFDEKAQAPQWILREPLCQ